MITITKEEIQSFLDLVEHDKFVAEDIHGRMKEDNELLFDLVVDVSNDDEYNSRQIPFGYGLGIGMTMMYVLFERHIQNQEMIDENE
jgi:hypothetical protein